MHCQWTIVAPRGNRIRLDFSEFQLETSQQCSYDRLEIEQLNNDAVAENRKYCREMPAPITTFTDTVTLRFISDNSYGASGFRVEYTVIGCVELMRTASGVLHSPNYPAAYPGNMECLWRIEVPHGNLVELRLHDYDFPDTKNCTKDGVRITADMDMFNNVCGQREVLHPPPVFTSHTNVMEVRFYSSGEHAGRGFNATYRTVSESKWKHNNRRNICAQITCIHFTNHIGVHLCRVWRNDVHLSGKHQIAQLSNELRQQYVL